MAGKNVGIPQARSCARSCESTLALLPTLLFRVFAVVLIVGTMHVSPVWADSTEACLQQAPPPTAFTSVHVQPDAGIQPVLDEITYARCSIDLSMYLITSDEVVSALKSAVDRGIRVRVILDRQPYGSMGDQREMFDTLTGIGAEVKWGPDQFTYTHAKYMIVDDSVVLITNQNFTWSGFNRNREFGVVSTEARYVNEAMALFAADWNGTDYQDNAVHLVISPINARQSILGLIYESTESIWMYSEVLRDEEITQALNNAADRGVDVRILVNDSADEGDVPYFLDALSHGVQIRVLENPYVHSKVMIIDGSSALVGSHNYSYTSLNLNREVGVVLTDSSNVGIIVSVFESDWNIGIPVDSIS